MIGISARASLCGKVQAFDVMWRSLLDEDSVWELHAEILLGQKKEDGEAFHTGRFFCHFSVRLIMIEKWAETLDLSLRMLTRNVPEP